MVHDDVCAHIAGGGAFLGNLLHLGPGNGVVDGAGIQVVHIYAALPKHLFVVVEGHRGLGSGDGIELAVISTLSNGRAGKIRGVREVGVQRDGHLVSRIVGHLGAVHIENVGQLPGGHGGGDLVVVGVGIRAVDGLPGHLNLWVGAVPLCQLFHPPVLHSLLVRGLPDGQVYGSIVLGTAAARRQRQRHEQRKDKRGNSLFHD